MDHHRSPVERRCLVGRRYRGRIGGSSGGRARTGAGAAEARSSPILRRRGTPTGDAVRCDNRRVLRETARRAANYRHCKDLSTTKQTLALVTAVSNRQRQGFIHIIDHSEHAGTVIIRATDDAGERFGRVSLRLEPGAAVHFNSADVVRPARARVRLERAWRLSLPGRRCGGGLTRTG